jgi:hypothetical protein
MALRKSKNGEKGFFTLLAGLLTLERPDWFLGLRKENCQVLKKIQNWQSFEVFYLNKLIIL